MVVSSSLRRPSSGRLNVKQIGLDERPRVHSLEALPAIEIDERRGIRKLLLKAREVFRVDIEPQKGQALLGDEGFDLRDRELVLHDMEQHVAAIAHREEVMDRAKLAAQRFVRNERL